MNSPKQLEENYADSLYLFQRIKARGLFPQSFYEVNISLIMQPKILEEIKTTDQ